MTRLGYLIAAAALGALPGCASTGGDAPVKKDKVAVYQSVVNAPPSYRIVKRLWVESWVSAFTVPSYGSQAEAEEAFRQHAADLGGNGVINFGCYRVPGIFGNTRLACNGTVVRFL